jgi:diguanylate cyclase (GGDEF)-like protein
MTMDHEQLLNDFEYMLKRRNVVGLRLGTLLISLMFSFFWILDWVVMPEWIELTLALRLLGTVFSLGIWVMTFRRSELVYRHADTLGILLGVFIGWLITIMSWMDHGYESPYYAGLNLVMLGASFLFTWPLRFSLIFSALLYSFYMAPLLTGSIAVQDPGIALTNQAFLLSTILVSVIAQRHRLIQEQKGYIDVQQHRVLLEQAQLLASTDPLTGLSNRRHFLAMGTYELGHARRLNKPLFVLAIDMDHFKQINDAHGHLVGDEVLRAAAHAFQSSLRQDDTLARMGGDEFVALLPGTDLREATVVAERIRLAMQDLSIPGAQVPVQVTVSVGVAPLTEDIVDLDALLLRTDEALYTAKRAGRARVHIWSLDAQPDTVAPLP